MNNITNGMKMPTTKEKIIFRLEEIQEQCISIAKLHNKQPTLNTTQLHQLDEIMSYAGDLLYTLNQKQ